MPPFLNITIPVPPGSTTHSTPGLLCTPASALDLLTFYLLNYIAHAATVLTRPGEHADDYAAAVIGALLFPALGLYRGIDAILSGAVWVRNDDLRKAARSGALCFVVRGEDWRPKAGEGESVDGVLYRASISSDVQDERLTTETQSEVEDREKSSISRRNLTGSTLTFSRSSTSSSTTAKKDKKGKDTDSTKGANQTHLIPFSPPYISTRFGHPVFAHRRIIHGTHVLPPGYRFAILPPTAALAPACPTSSSTLTVPTTSLSAQPSTLKSLIALLQSIYALSTLYRARGDQISQFGFAAFGLTVAPYAVMSIMNLFGNICRPEYASLYMVGGSVMEEAKRRGGVFEGCVGRVVEEEGGCGGWVGSGEMGEDVGRVRFMNESKSRQGSAHEAASERDEKKEENKKKEENSDAGTVDGSEETITAHFSTLSASSKLTSTTTTTAAVIAPLPKKLNYKDTNNAALLLIPSHPPFKTTTTTTTTTISPRPTLSTLLLRTNLICAHYTWTPTFTRTPTTRLATYWRWIKYLLLTSISLLPLLITGIMSGFHGGSIPKHDSNTWKVYTAQWLGCGVLTGLWWVVDQEGKEALASVRGQVGPWLRVWLYLSSASPAVGGFVVVGQMLGRYGSCVWVGD